MKKTFSVILALIMALSVLSIIPVSAEEAEQGSPSAFKTSQALYAHAVVNSADSNAWVAWQSEHDESLYEVNSNEKYFFLPSSAAENKVDIYNAYSTDVTVNGVTIAPEKTKTVDYNINQSYQVTAGGRTYTLRFMKSNAEAAVYVNNSDADGNGTDLMSYLNSDKSLSAKASGAIVDRKGKIDNTAIKKIKGRGNTTWDKPKKGYNITYDAKVSIGGMAKSKKYSLLANYQDDSLSRNRFLYDLSDAVGMPYASDSRYVDFYANGYYWGSYQMCEKVDTGGVLNDISGDEYLNEDGTLAADFPFVAEVDASASSDDYYFVASNGTKVTLKAPELDADDPNYDAVLNYAKSKFDTFARTTRNKNGKVSQYGDVESLAKIFLINELGKNWDSGVSSTFFTYKPDSEGNYKFYGSPVWDYDNSLGNAVGVERDLRNMGVSDYEKYTGWWCRYKGKNSGDVSSSNNIINQLSVNNEVMAAVPGIWFNEFVPAINHFEGIINNGKIADEMYSKTEYYNSVKDTAEMNYKSGWLLTTSGWIANHSSLNKASYDYDKKSYKVSSSATRYANNFDGMFNYAADWMTSRAAWISNELSASYEAGYLYGDVTRDGEVSVSDAYEVQLYCAQLRDFNAAETELGDVNFDNQVTVSDATLIQQFAAEMISNFKNPSKPDQPDEPTSPVEPTNPVEPTSPVNPTDPQGSYTVTFTDMLGWGDTIYCYSYDSNAVYVAPWPGTKMNSAGTNAAGKNEFTLSVPANTAYVIFSNGTVQTEKIPFDGTKLRFYAIDQINAKGRYEFAAE